MKPDRSIDDEMCPTLNATRIGQIEQTEVWESDRTGCPGQSDEQFGIQSSCTIARGLTYCEQNAASSGVCGEWAERKNVFLRSPAHRDFPAVEYCDTVPPLDVDMCYALEQLCGSRGRSLRCVSAQWRATAMRPAAVHVYVFCLSSCRCVVLSTLGMLWYF